tara:strand:+ start:6864 stop:8399 length:1536 start_codon:yes stop_codon:yes gene_type:complete
MINTKDPIVILPLCGIGKRFRRAGYSDHKAVLKIFGKNMIERVINKFPLSTSIYIISTESIQHELLSSSDSWSVSNKLNWIIIKSHTFGPAYSIYQSLDYIPTGRPAFISYCDITWDWNNEYPSEIEAYSDAAIFIHKGFHPHLVKNSFSAFCKSDRSSSFLKEIKEKGSFTDNWMNELLSIGLFYVAKIEILFKSLRALIDENNSINGEFYPSLLYNYLLKENIKVDLIEVRSFVHYGTPDQLTDFMNWGEYFLNQRSIKNSNNLLKLPSILLASGTGSRMKGMTATPKPLITIGGQSLLDKVIINLPINKQNLNIVINEHSKEFKELELDCSFHIIKSTNSQFDSLVESIDLMKSLNSFLLCSCDCFGEFDIELLRKSISVNKFDVICFGFKPTLLQSKLAGHTYFTPNDDRIESIHIKAKSSDEDFGLAGFFFINSATKLVKIINQIKNVRANLDINRELIVDDVIKLMVELELSVGWIPLNNYFHLGSIDEFKEYEYWYNYISALSD